MPINFPSNPANNQIYSYGGQTWYWANNYGYWQANTVTAIGYTGSKGAIATFSNSAPVSPSVGDFWWNTDVGNMFVYFYDGDTFQWVTASQALPGATGYTGSFGYTGSSGAGSGSTNKTTVYTYNLIFGRG